VALSADVIRLQTVVLMMTQIEVLCGYYTFRTVWSQQGSKLSGLGGARVLFKVHQWHYQQMVIRLQKGFQDDGTRGAFWIFNVLMELEQTGSKLSGLGERLLNKVHQCHYQPMVIRLQKVVFLILVGAVWIFI